MHRDFVMHAFLSTCFPLASLCQAMRPLVLSVEKERILHKTRICTCKLLSYCCWWNRTANGARGDGAGKEVEFQRANI